MEKQLNPGMAVRCSDGDGGRLEKIVTESDEHKAAYLVVRRGLPARRRDIVVPVSLVRDVSQDMILLDTTVEALETFPDYEVTVSKRVPPPTIPTGSLPALYWPPYADRAAITFRERSVPETSMEITRGMQVYDSDGAKAGKVEGVVVDGETRQASHLVLGRKGLRGSDPRVVPVDLIDFVLRDQIYLRITQDQVLGLTVYRTEQSEAASSTK